MKNLIITELSILLVASISLNAALLVHTYVKNPENETEIVEDETTSITKESDSPENSDIIQEELIGVWNANDDSKIEIQEDGTVYLTYWTETPSDVDLHVYACYIGKIDGSAIVLSQKYNGSLQDDYHDASEEELESLYTIYEVTLYGSSALTIQRADDADSIKSYVKEE